MYSILFCTYIVFLLYICFMNCKATITLNDKVKKAGQEKARDKGLRGGFSEYIEKLIVEDLKSK